MNRLPDAVEQVAAEWRRRYRMNDDYEVKEEQVAKKFEVAIETPLVHGGTGRVEHEIEADSWEVGGLRVGENRMEMLRMFVGDGAEGKRVVFAAPAGRLLWISEVDAANE